MIYDFTTLPDRWDAGAFKYEHMKKQKPDVSRDAVPLSVADMEFLDPPEVVRSKAGWSAATALGPRRNGSSPAPASCPPSTRS